MSSPQVPSKRQWLRNLFNKHSVASSSASPCHESVPSDSPQQSRLSENLKISGRFALSVLPRIAGCVDENPAKMAFNILNVIMEVRKEINDNKDELQRVLEETSMLLNVVLREMETGPDGQSSVNQVVEQYKREVTQQLEHIKALNDCLTSSPVTKFDYESYKQHLTEVSRRIAASTNRFNTVMAGTTGIMVHELRDDKREEKLRKDLNPSKVADHRFIHDGKGALMRKTCTEGTRVKILKEITDWANDSAVGSPSVFWLTGQAGAGKTTIAYTIAKRFGEGHSTALGACFFCSRQFGETRSLQRILPTIAFQLARQCEPYRIALFGVDTSDAVDSHGVDEQIQKFLFKPWMSRVDRHRLPTYLIVVDALDEIENTNRSSFLKALLESVEKDSITGLKFLVTSRADPAIAKLCKSFPPGAICQLQNVPVEEAKQDVKTYLNVELTDLNGTPELDKLNEKAAGLFIYAATVVKILTKSELDVDEQLLLLRRLLSSTSSSLNSIDQLYQQIMRDAFEDLDDDLLRNRLHILYTFLCSGERISASVASSLVDTKVGIASKVLDSLHSVLYVEDGRVYWYHASFPDFMFSRARSNFRMDDKEFMFSCDTAAQHSFLTDACFRIMNSEDSGLRFNMGDIKSSYLLDREHAEELRENVSKNISPALTYACMYWAHHVSLSSTTHNSQVYDAISDFLRIRVLFWIEAMNLLGSSGECSHLLQQASSWVSKQNNSALVKDLQEVSNFGAYFAGCPTAYSTPHLYISSLATWPASFLSRSWKDYFPRIPVYEQSGGVVALPIMTKRFHDRVEVIAFSHDSKQIVVILYNSVVVVDATTGRQQHILNVTNCKHITFSQDGTRLVTISNPGGLPADYVVSIWDASLFRLLHEFNVWRAIASIEGTQILTICKERSDGYHDVQVLDILNGTLLRTMTISQLSHWYTEYTAFSSTAMKFMISLEDFIEIWDMSSERALRTVTVEDCDFWEPIAMSADGKLGAAVTSYNGSEVRLFDASTGHTLFLLPHDQSIKALDFSNDATRIVTGSDYGTLHVWDTATGARLQVLTTNNVAVDSVTFTKDGLRIGSGLWNTIYVWSLDDKSAERACGAENDSLSSAGYTKVSISDDSTKIMCFTEDTAVKVWDLTTGAELMTTSGFIRDARMSGNAENIVCSLRDGSVKVFNVANGDEILHLQNEVAFAARVISSRSGRKFGLIMATHSYKAAQWIEIWGVESGKQAEFTLGPFCYASPPTFSDDERYIVGELAENENNDVSVFCCDILTGNTHRIKSKMVPYHRLLSNNGEKLAVCSEELVPNDSFCEVWDISSGKYHRKFKLSYWPHDPDDEGSVRIYSFGLSNNGEKIVANCSDGFIRVWSAIADENVADVMLVYCSQALCTITLSRDNKLVATGSSDGSVQLWDLDDDPHTEKYAWALQKDGWITSPRNMNHRLMWVSEILKIKQPRNTTIIPGPGYGSVDFSKAMIGDDWEKCYFPRHFVDEDK